MSDTKGMQCKVSRERRGSANVDDAFGLVLLSLGTIEGGGIR